MQKLNMPKSKLTVFFLLLAFITGMGLVPVMADQTQFYISEVFDDYTTNTKPATGKLTGSGIHVVEHKQGEDKSLQLKSVGSEAAAAYDATPVSDKTIISADILFSKSRPDGKIILRDKSNKAFNAVLIKNDGSVCTYDERIIGTIGMDSFTNIAVAVSLKAKRYSVYINGKMAVSDWYVESGFPAGIGGVTFSFSAASGNESEIDLDDLYMYDGEKPLNAAFLPKKPFSKDATDYVEEVIQDETPGDKLYINRSFDEQDVSTFEGLTPAAKTNVIALEKEKKSGNQYIHIIKETADDCYVDMYFTDPARYIMIEADFSSDNPAAAMQLFQTKDSDNKFNYMFSTKAGGDITMSDGQTVGRLIKGKWINLAVAADFRKRTFNAYVDKKLVAENVAMSNQEIGLMTVLRIYIGGGATPADLKFDNLKVYEGKEFKELKEGAMGDRTSIMPASSGTIDKMKSMKVVALQLDSGSIFANGTKSQMDVPAYTEDGRTLVPVRAVSDGLGLKVDWDEVKQLITIDGKIKMTIGSKDMEVDGKKVSLDVAPETKDGRAFLPLRALAQDALGKKVTWNERGLILIGDQEVTDEKTILELNDYMLYTRPSAEDITALFESYNKNQHPRVMANKATFDTIKENFTKDPTVMEWGKTVIKGADGTLNVAPSKYEIPDGLRLLATSRRVLDRTQQLAMAYILTGDMKYVDRAWVELSAAGNFPDWNPKHYLDVGEMTSAFAIGYDWLYDAWTDEQKKFLEESIVKFGLKNSDKAYYGQLGSYGWWAKGDNNWNMVCNGGTTLGAVAVFDKYPELCSDILRNAVRGVEFMIKEFYPDGAWYEGPGYWGYTIKYMTMMYSTLDAAFGTDFYLSDAYGTNNTAEFALHMDGPVSMNNFHDVGPGHINAAELFWLSRKYGKPGVTSARLFNMEYLKFTPTALDILFYDANIKAKYVDLPLQGYFRETEAVSMRTSFTNPEGVYASYHAGVAVANHSHLDCGTFVLDMMGERFAMDLGGDDYNLPDYFGKLKHSYYRLRPEGHNTLLINPDEKEGQDLDADTKIETLQGKPRGAFSIADLTTAYKTKANSVRRGIKLEDERRSLLIRDELDLKGQSEIYWFMHTTAKIEIVDDRTAVLDIKGKKVQLKFITDAPSATLSVMDAVPLPKSPNPEKQNANSGIRKVAIKLQGSGKMYVAVKLIPMSDPLKDKPLENIALNDWSIPDGEIKPVPTANMIYIDGTPITEFKPETTMYTVKVPMDQTAPPAITVNADDDKTVEITSAATLEEQAIVKVADKDNPDNYKLYTIMFRIIPKMEDINGMTRYQVATVLASDNPQPENADVNALDGDLETRWSADGDGQWLQVDLGDIKRIDAVGVAAYNGASRATVFDIAVSTDGAQWETVYKGQTSGTTNSMEFIGIQNKQARYVKLIGHGNTSNTWNSITEFAVLGNK